MAMTTQLGYEIIKLTLLNSNCIAEGGGGRPKIADDLLCFGHRAEPECCVTSIACNDSRLEKSVSWTHNSPDNLHTLSSFNPCRSSLHLLKGTLDSPWDQSMSSQLPPPYPSQHEPRGDVTAMRRQLILSWVLMLVLVLLLLLPAFRLWFNFGVTGDPRPITPRGALADYEQTTVDLFTEVSPSVVYITTKARYADRFFGRTLDVESGTGSGFVWDSDGHVVTNFHVIENASKAQVVFADQTAYEAIPVGISPDHDLAVLRITAPAEYLRPVLIGESSSLAVGQSVFAIGNPFGFQQTLTTGVVSAKNRTIRSPSERIIEDVIQIDAAINPGNSGGPLLDSAGRLIGVNTAIYSPSGASVGVGFSIPVDTVNRIVPQIIRRGSYETPQLGILVTDEISLAVSRRTGIRGVVIREVVEGGAAEKAGLRGLQSSPTRGTMVGDIITSVNGQPVQTVSDIQNALAQSADKPTAQITVFRDGKEIDVKVAF